VEGSTKVLADDLRAAVGGPMGGAHDDLAELASFGSVAAAEQFPAEECEKAARRMLDASLERSALGAAPAGRCRGPRWAGS
jgi:hypothetical protein